MATITLNSGNKMPLVGKGLWKVDNETCADTVYNAIKVGYRLFDGAADYGNEKESGEGVARAIKDGLVKREELFITSKLWCTFRTKEEVDAIVKKQLADWQLEYFDLLLIHFPIALKWVDPEHRYPPAWFADDGKTIETVNVPYQETYKALEGVKVAGFAKDIGVSNIQGSALIDVFRYAKIPPAVLQIEHHPYLTQEPLVALCKEYDVAITAYSSFGPQSFLELGMAADIPSLLKHDEVAKIADAHKKTSAEVLLRWATQRGIAVIPKSNNKDRLAQNLNHTEFDLTEAELKAVSALNKNLRFNDPKNYLGVKHSIFA